MVINAYVDESYAEPRTFALGCAMARSIDWFEINRQWKRYLTGRIANWKRWDGACFPLPLIRLQQHARGL